MKVVILAGGLGTRLSEETHMKPKPMIEIGDQPLLLHIMRNFAAQGFTEFIVCLGYKGYVIKEYFANLRFHLNDLHFESFDSDPIPLNNSELSWKVDLIDTGHSTLTGGRLKRIKEFTCDETFIMTYGDGLADIDVAKLVNFHKSSGSAATVTAVIPPARFGALEIENSGKVLAFNEKVDKDSNWINGGFFVLEQEIFDYIEGDMTTWEKEPLVRLSELNKLSAYKHYGFWKPCDTLREKGELEELWKNGAPWKNWI
jgi:glucose-1-phosphate cytidylyltransferase